MPDDVRLTEAEWHTKCAKDLFNQTWDYLDKTDRTLTLRWYQLLNEWHRVIRDVELHGGILGI